MSVPIFGTEAPKYFARGISVTPLIQGQKKAHLPGWQLYHDHLPTPAEQEQWCQQFAFGNIGLLPGKQSGIVIIDIDTKDPEIIKAVMSIMPPSPWKRIGNPEKWAGALAFKYNGERNRRITNDKGEMLVEILSSRTQLVLPPSIHPDTKKPYTSNANLLDVVDDLVKLPDNFEEKLIAILSTVTKLSNPNEGFRMINYVSAGSRDVSMTRHAGLLAYSILQGELSVKRAIDNMIAWGESFVQQVTGDALDVQKGISHIIQFLLRDVNTKNKVLPPGWDEGLTDDEKTKLGLGVTEEQQEWTVERILSYIGGELMAHEGVNNPQRLAAVEFTLRKVVQSKSLTSTEQSRITNFLSKNAGIGLNAANYNKRIKELKSGPIQGVNHTEIALAAIEEFKDKIGELRYQSDDLWRWDGSHWTPVPAGEIESFIAREYGFMDAAKKHGDIIGIRKSMQTLVPQELKTIHIEGVNFANGFLTTELKLLPHNSAYGMTYTMPFRYMPELANKAVQFQEMLNFFWSDDDDRQEKILALKEAMCTTIFGISPKYAKVFCMYGPGGTGKSQVLDIASFLVPDSARSAVPPHKWNKDFVPSMLFGKLMNVAGELSESQLIDGPEFKQIIDGSEITAQFKNADLFQFRPTAAHWFSSNYLPKTRDSSSGFNRRWLFLQFRKIIKQSAVKVDLGKKVAQEEIEAIAAWAIEAMPTILRQNGYTLPASHLRLSENMALQNSTVRQFIKDCAVESPGASVPEEIVYRKYFQYTMGVLRGKPVGAKRFELDLDQFIQEMTGFSVKVEGGKRLIVNMAVNDRIVV